VKIRRIVPLAAIGVLALGAVMPAQAAPKKFAGSYSVTLLPDPTPNAFVLAGKENCFNVNPAAVDKHPLTVPRAGKLSIVLDSPDPTGTGNTDWDLFLVDKGGETIDSSHGGSSHEEVTSKFKGKADVTIIVCNLVGQPNGTVTYSLR
jgi:hypothetical protein